MKKAGNKMRMRLRVRQKIATKMIMIYSICSAVILIFLTLFFNMADIPKLKANDIEIRQMEEQVFKNDMSLPSPEIKSAKTAGPNTIFIRKIKQSNILSEPNHE